MTHEDFKNIRFVRKLALALDGLLGANANTLGSLPETYKKANPEYMKDAPDLRRQYLKQRRLEYWDGHVKSLDMSQVYVERAPGVDLLLEFDATRPYHQWGVYLEDREIAARRLLVPRGIYLVLLGPGSPPKGVYHLPELPPLPMPKWEEQHPEPPRPRIIRTRRNRELDAELLKKERFDLSIIENDNQPF